MHITRLKFLLAKGFSLLELMIVVAIIGILVAIFIVSQTESREQAYNKAMLQQIDQYSKALELYYTDNLRYPSGHGNGNLSFRNRVYCIGEGFTGGACMPDNVPRHYEIDIPSEVEAVLSGSEYISTLPTAELSGEGGTYSSPAYSGCNETGNNCAENQYSLWFLLKGTNRDCGRAMLMGNTVENRYTLCRMGQDT